MRLTLAPSTVVQGMVMMCTASLCFSLNDTFTKFLVFRYGIPEIIFLRSLIALPLLAAMAIVIGRTKIRWSSRLFFHAIRGALNLAAAYLYINGLQYLSVAETTVILFSSPLIVTLASVFFFKEVVGWQKWAAALCSFTGVVIAIRPGAEAFQPASLFILASSFLYAANSLTARWIPEADNLWTISFFGAAFSALFVAPLAVSEWIPVHSEDLMFLTAAALCSSLGIGLSSLAYRLAQASDLAPYAYSGLIWSLGITMIVWGSVPTLWTFLGAAVIAASSLFHFLTSRQ
ncbi:DMT family transporter [Rhizobium sp. LjRoot30]|uniref:DMT family transporter n=1 Tax=Rhizobium sp. LjRoot30 TaxID=3342320 RepID=UPI003ECD8BA7